MIKDRAKQDPFEQYSKIRQQGEVSLLENWLKISAITVSGDLDSSTLKFQRAFKTRGSGLHLTKMSPPSNPKASTSISAAESSPQLLVVYQSYAWKE